MNDEEAQQLKALAEAYGVTSSDIIRGLLHRLAQQPWMIQGTYGFRGFAPIKDRDESEAGYPR